jgi:GNAT superfamily N-acetyltransferase
MRLNLFLNEAELGKLLVKHSSEMTKKEYKDFYVLVDEGGQAYVTLSSIKKYGKLFAFYYIDDELASVAAIKDDHRKEDIFDASETEEDPDDYKYEIGWFYTKPEYRKLGLNTRLFKALWDRVNHGLFMTIRINNKESLSNAKKYGFKKTGVPIDAGVFDIVLLVKKK